MPTASGATSILRRGLSKWPIHPTLTTNLMHCRGATSKSSFLKREDNSHFPLFRAASLTHLYLFVNTDSLNKMSEEKFKCANTAPWEIREPFRPLSDLKN